MGIDKDDRAFEISQRRMLQGCMEREEQEYLIIEKEYWYSAVRVFTGITWFIAGIIFTMVVHAIFY
jgi:lysozyme family protein